MGVNSEGCTCTKLPVILVVLVILPWLPCLSTRNIDITYVTMATGEKCYFESTEGSGYCFLLGGASPATWTEAYYSCQMFGGQLLRKPARSTTNVVNQVMAISGVAEAWIGMTKVNIPWTWSNGHYLENISSIEWASDQPSDLGSGGDCVLLDTSREYQMVTSPCHQTTGFVCETGLDTHLCQHKGGMFTEVVVMDNRCFLFMDVSRDRNANITWFDAKDACASYGDDTKLAQMDADVQDVVKEIKPGVKFGIKSYWVGLTRARWIAASGLVIEQLYLGIGLKDICVAMETSHSNQPSLIARDCDTKENYICEIDITTLPAKGTISAASASELEDDNSTALTDVPETVSMTVASEEDLTSASIILSTVLGGQEPSVAPSSDVPNTSTFRTAPILTLTTSTTSTNTPSSTTTSSTSTHSSATMTSSMSTPPFDQISTKDTSPDMVDTGWSSDTKIITTLTSLLTSSPTSSTAHVTSSSKSPSSSVTSSASMSNSLTSTTTMTSPSPESSVTCKISFTISFIITITVEINMDNNNEENSILILINNITNVIANRAASACIDITVDSLDPVFNTSNDNPQGSTDRPKVYILFSKCDSASIHQFRSLECGSGRYCVLVCLEVFDGVSDKQNQDILQNFQSIIRVDDINNLDDISANITDIIRRYGDQDTSTSTSAANHNSSHRFTSDPIGTEMGTPTEDTPESAVSNMFIIIVIVFPCALMLGVVIVIVIVVLKRRRHCSGESTEHLSPRTRDAHETLARSSTRSTHSAKDSSNVPCERTKSLRRSKRGVVKIGPPKTGIQTTENAPNQLFYNCWTLPANERK